MLKNLCVLIELQLRCDSRQEGQREMIIQFFGENYTSSNKKHIKCLSTIGFQINEIVQLVQFLDPSTFKVLRICLFGEVEADESLRVMKAENFIPLISYNEGFGLKLTISLFNEVPINTLMEIKKLLQHSLTLMKISVNYKRSLGIDPHEFFAPFMFKQSEIDGFGILSFLAGSPQTSKQKTSVLVPQQPEVKVSYALTWLKNSKHSNSKITVVDINDVSYCIELQFENEADRVKIRYEKSKDTENLTTIQCEEWNKCTEVEYPMEHVFFKDFIHILMNQDRVLDLLEMYCKSSEENLDWVIEYLEKNFGNSRVKVRELFTYGIPMKKIIQFVQLLDPITFETLTISSEQASEKSRKVIKAEDFIPLISWNQGCCINLKFILLNEISIETLVGIKRLLRQSLTAWNISLHYKKSLRLYPHEFFAPFTFIQSRTENNKSLFFNSGDFQNAEMEESGSNEQLAKKSNWLYVFALEDLMEHILKYCDFFVIQRLRKVSHYIRNCIDEMKPDSGLSEYNVNGNWNGCTYIMIVGKHAESITYRTKGIEKTLAVIGCDHEVNCENDSESTLIDFEINLKHQKICLKLLTLISHSDDLLDKIGLILSSWSPFLKVEKLVIGVKNEQDLLKILPYIDPNPFKYLHIVYDIDRVCSKDNEQRYIQLDGLCQLDQWKNAEKLIIENFFMVTPAQELGLLGFVTVEIMLSELSDNDIVYLKEGLTESTIFNKFKIRYEKSAVTDSLFEFMPPYRRVNNVRSFGISK